jgi:pimeloyl-ACP methyl ester carboxylesterase
MIMKKIYGIVALAVTLLGAALSLKTPLIVGAAQSAAPTGIKNVVLVHGAFADGSGWEAVAKILEKDGYTVSVAQPPETSYAADQKYTKAAIDAMGGPVVLVGHSYGGSIITEAGNHPNVAALVYIAAFALDEGESCASIEQALPQASNTFTPGTLSDKPPQGHDAKCGFACHTMVQKRDYVFHKLRDEASGEDSSILVA